jgi:hypothetical protein
LRVKRERGKFTDVFSFDTVSEWERRGQSFEAVELVTSRETYRKVFHMILLEASTNAMM